MLYGVWDWLCSTATLLCSRAASGLCVAQFELKGDAGWLHLTITFVWCIYSVQVLEAEVNAAMHMNMTAMSSHITS
jgi:hypothetical protein